LPLEFNRSVKNKSFKSLQKNFKKSEIFLAKDFFRLNLKELETISKTKRKEGVTVKGLQIECVAASFEITH